MTVLDMNIKNKLKSAITIDLRYSRRFGEFEL